MSDTRDYKFTQEQLSVLEGLNEFTYNDESESELMASIAVDQWGNEWDGGGDFGDIDFRTVDDY